MNKIRGKMKRNIFYFSLMLLLFSINLYAQQTNNLQIIWQKVSPESILYFGRDIASGDVNNDGFSDIMIIGDSIVGPFPYRGKCWVYFGGINFDTISDVQLLNTEQNIFWSVISGDINGDGFSDVILGACNNANGFGEVLIFTGGNPMNSNCDYRITGGPYQGSNFGCDVSTGDINGDGYKDLIVGAYNAFVYPIGDLAGRVYIYFGGPNFDTIPDVILNGGHNNDQEAFGSTVSGSGDVNNDGYDDVIVGAMNYGYNHGRVYIYYGGNPMNTTYDVVMMGEEAGESIGEFSVDLLKNYQTFDNAVFGTPLWGPSSPQGNNPGKVYVLFGGNPMDSVPDIWMVGRTTESELGHTVHSAGRCFDDYYDEIIAGAPIENGTGTAYFWLGGSIMDTIPDAWLRGTQSVIGIGWRVATAGDINSDGRDEIMISNPAGGPKKVWVCKYTGVGVEENRQPLFAVRLPLKVYPNPAKTNLAIRLPQTADRINIKIYDVAGKTVKVIDARSKRQEAGKNEIRWNLRDENIY